MAWFLNYYKCAQCGRRWSDEWSCTCDDECPRCGARDMEATRSDDLTTIIEREGDVFILLRSPEFAEHDPDYQELGRFKTERQAKRFAARH